MICKICDKPLNQPQHREHQGRPVKSCPRCSQEAEQHLFYSLEALDEAQAGETLCLACQGEKDAPEPVTACSLPPDWDEDEERERIQKTGERLEAMTKRLRAILEEERTK